MNQSVPIPHYEEVCTILRQYGVSYAGLFGSRLAGDNRSESDYDLLIEFAPDSKTTFLGIMKLQGQLEDILGHPVDLVTKRGLSPYIGKYILSSVRQFYGQES